MARGRKKPDAGKAAPGPERAGGRGRARASGRWARVGVWLGRIVLGLALVLAAVLIAYGLLPDPADYLHEEPSTTAFIEQRVAEARTQSRGWLKPTRVPVPLTAISPVLVRAVVLSEDGRFWNHDGLDWFEIRASVERDLAERSFVRGGSTISQQLVKNLYLGPEKTILRKVEEALLAVKLERALEKKRILSLYLNVAEWGEGVFGVEAGARRHFGVGARQLAPHQAALLAAMLPAPRRASLEHPSPRLAARARRVLRLLRDAHVVTDAVYGEESRQLEGRLRGRPSAEASKDEEEED